MKLDAHCHTDCSDGNITIEERIGMIRRLGFDAATITDHDFISPEQVARASAAAKELPYIPGIEISVAHEGQVVHILGYYVDPFEVSLQMHIAQVQEVDRMITGRLLKVFHTKGAQFGLEDLIAPSLHTFYSLQLVKRVARDLYANDQERTLHSFLNVIRWLGISYAEFTPWPVRKAIDLIHQSGGFAVLAHPGGSEDLVMQALDFLCHTENNIRQYVDWGLDGIEVACPVHTLTEKLFYTDIAARYSLLTTAGSDCHGDDPYLGPALMGTFDDIPEDLYDRMLAYHQKMQGL
jgi:predicted metal-dependent phosphoesterase TrpH